MYAIYLPNIHFKSAGRSWARICTAIVTPGHADEAPPVVKVYHAP